MTQTAAPQIGLLTKVYIQTAQGTALTIAAGVVTGGTAIGGLKKVTPPKPKWGTEDVTVLSTPNTGRLKIKTLLDYGTVKLEGLYESADAGQTALAAAFLIASNTTNGAGFQFFIEEPINLAGGQSTQGDVIGPFTALVTDWEVGEGDIDKVIPFSAELTISGPCPVTVGS